MKFADFYSAKPPSQIIQAGYQGVMRYISHDTAKCVSKAEVTGYRGTGLAVGLVFEDRADNSLGGFPAGQADGVFARQIAQQVNYPQGSVIFAAVDFAATDQQLGTIAQYFSGFASVMGGSYPVGVYGDARVLQALIPGYVAWGWQTVAWSNGARAASAELLQDSFGQVFDGNDVLRPVPLWGFDDAKAAAAAAAAPDPQPPFNPNLPTDSNPTLETEMPSVILTVPTDGDGNGSVILDGASNSTQGIMSVNPAVPFAKFVAATPWGVDPAADGGYHSIPQVSVQNRGGWTLVTYKNCPANSSGTPVAQIVFVG